MIEERPIPSGARRGALAGCDCMRSAQRVRSRCRQTLAGALRDWFATLGHAEGPYASSGRDRRVKLRRRQGQTARSAPGDRRKRSRRGAARPEDKSRRCASAAQPSAPATRTASLLRRGLPKARKARPLPLQHRSDASCTGRNRRRRRGRRHAASCSSRRLAHVDTDRREQHHHSAADACPELNADENSGSHAQNWLSKRVVQIRRRHVDRLLRRPGTWLERSALGTCP